MKKILLYGIGFGAFSALLLFFQYYINPKFFEYSLEAFNFVDILIIMNNVSGIVFILSKNRINIYKSKNKLIEIIKISSIFSLLNSICLFFAYTLISTITPETVISGFSYDPNLSNGNTSSIFSFFNYEPFFFSNVRYRFIYDQIFSFILSCIFYFSIVPKDLKKFSLKIAVNILFKFLKITKNIIFVCVIVFVTGSLGQIGGYLGYSIGVFISVSIIMDYFNREKKKKRKIED